MLLSFPTYLIITSTILFTLLIIYLKWSFTYWARKGVPYLEPSIPFGNFYNPLKKKISIGFYFKTFYSQFKNMGKQFGGIYAFSSPVFVPTHPEINKVILVKEFQNFRDRGMYYNEKNQPTSANLLTIDGDRWKTLRTKLTPTFTSARVKSMFHLMKECGRTLGDHVEEYAASKTPLNVRDCARRLTADVIGSCAFGIECNSFRDPTFHYTLERIFDRVRNFLIQTFCTNLPDFARLLGIPLMPPKDVNIIVDSINETVKFRAEKNVVRNDFLQILLEMKGNGVIDMEELRAQSVLFFVGGYESSATALNFALFELAYNEEVQDKLRKEIKEVLLGYGDLTYEAVQDMKYLQMVVDETLRKYPPIPTLKRRCTKDFQLPNSNVILEKGTIIFVPIIGFHHDPEFFPNPNKFDPERFSDENIGKIVPYTYLPFGDGPRNCIGDRFGKLQVKMGLVGLINNYKFSLNPQVKLPLAYLSGSTAREDIILDVEFVKK